MNQDFYQQYKGYSNTELLKIVKRPAEYQPKAVTVATQILTERQVTQEEHLIVDQYYHDIDSSANAKKQKVDFLKHKAADFFEPVLSPSENVQTSKWVNILLLAIAIQYAWLLFETSKRLLTYIQCDACSFDIIFFIDLSALIYVPLIFFLLFKRRRWGWNLLFADTLFGLISRVSQSYLFFKYQSIHQGDSAFFITAILVRAAIVFFLWREPVACYFGISDKRKKEIAMITTVCTLLIIIILNLTA